MGLKKALKNFLIGKKGSYTGKTTSDLLVESLNSAGGGGSSDIFIVNWILDETTEEEIPDKTYEEIDLAWQAGKRIKFNIGDNRLVDAFPTSTTTNVETGAVMLGDISAVWFSTFGSSDSNTRFYCYTIDNSDHITKVAKKVQFGS